MSVKVLDSDGSGTMDTVLRGINWAAEHGAKVINLSLGVIEQNLTNSAKSDIQTAVNHAWNDHGAIVVASAGNCGAADNNGQVACAIYDTSGNITGYASNPKFYPAASDNVLSVAAVDADSNLAGYSEYGDWVDVAAPGGKAVPCTGSDVSNCILSSYPIALISQPPAPTPTYQPYTYKKGTSMAAPMVAGVAALVWAVNSSFSNRQVVDLINNQAVAGNLSPGKTIHGMVDALRSLAAANSGATATPTPTGSITPSPTPTGPTETPVPTPTTGGSPTPKLPRTPPVPFPSPPYCPDTANCQKKTAGDADCNGIVEQRDYEIWKSQFDTMIPPVPANNNSNFSCIEGNIPSYFIDVVDFEIWRKNTQGGLR
jgi:subtilisin family serine protease